MTPTINMMGMYEWMMVGIGMLALLFGSGILIGFAKLIAIGVKLQTTVDLIKSNDLPHIQIELKELKIELSELRVSFQAHLDKGRENPSYI